MNDETVITINTSHEVSTPIETPAYQYVVMSLEQALSADGIHLSKQC